MKQVAYRPEAQADLDSIWDYSAETWGADQANRYVNQIRSVLMEVASGQKNTQSAQQIRPGYRKIRVGRHVVYILESADRIDIVRVLHERMDVGGIGE